MGRDSQPLNWKEKDASGNISTTEPDQRERPSAYVATPSTHPGIPQTAARQSSTQPWLRHLQQRKRILSVEGHSTVGPPSAVLRRSLQSLVPPMSFLGLHTGQFMEPLYLRPKAPCHHATLPRTTATLSTVPWIGDTQDRKQDPRRGLTDAKSMGCLPPSTWMF